MNSELEIKQLEARLAELQAETGQTLNETEQESESPASDSDLFAPVKPREGKRLPHVQGQNDPRDNVKNFRPGDFYWRSSWNDAHLERQLVPYPQYANPGQPFTNFDEEWQYEQEHSLWLRGGLTLQACVYRTVWKNSGSPYYNQNSEDAQREDLIWLNGVLAGRGLPLITEDQLQEWAKSPKQFAKMEDRSPYQIPEAEEK